ncbi:hypothetical protein FRC07_003956 [Ceratobasidium sp. 392]|nr:hypothetical protein FRC07_003956 [Ceratobasidium sp. 392]
MSVAKTNLASHPPVAVITGAAQVRQQFSLLRKLETYYILALTQELASEGYQLALGDLLSSQNQLQLVVDECIEIQRSSVASSQGAIPRTLAVVCDVSSESQVESLVQRAVEELDGIDVMVANAGIYKGATLLETTDKILDDVYAVNVKGVLYSYRAAARAMIPRGGGRIVGACSAAGKTGFPLEGAYCASKFAVRSLTQTAAREWGQHGITVNTYAPGPTDTDMWNKVVMSEAPARSEESKQTRSTAASTYSKAP